MDFSSDANADFEGLLEVNRGICMPQMAEKTEPDAPPNCAVVPKKMRAMFTLRPQAEGLFRQSAPRGSGHVSPPPSAANHPRRKAAGLLRRFPVCLRPGQSRRTDCGRAYFPCALSPTSPPASARRTIRVGGNPGGSGRWAPRSRSGDGSSRRTCRNCRACGCPARACGRTAF